MPPKCGGDGGSGAQKRAPVSLPDAVGAKKKTSTPSTSDRSTHQKSTNVNLVQGKTVDVLRTATSYFDAGWNTFCEFVKLLVQKNRALSMSKFVKCLVRKNRAMLMSKFAESSGLFERIDLCRCPRISGGGIEWVFFSAGKQHDALKKRTMDKTLESTLKAGINTKLSTCDDKGAFTDDEGT